MSEIDTNPRDAAKTAKTILARFVFYLAVLWLIQLAFDRNQVPPGVVIIGAAVFVLSSTLLDRFLPKQMEQTLEPSSPAKRFDRNATPRQGSPRRKVAVTVGFSLSQFSSLRARTKIRRRLDRQASVIYLISIPPGLSAVTDFLKLTRAFTGRHRGAESYNSRRTKPVRAYHLNKSKTENFNTWHTATR